MKNIKQLLGKRIKELRLAQSFSQQKLAELINIDQRSLSYIECGGAFPSKCLGELAIALKVDLKELFDFNHLTLDDVGMKDYIIQSIEVLQTNDIKTVYRIIKSMR